MMIELPGADLGAGPGESVGDRAARSCELTVGADHGLEAGLRSTSRRLRGSSRRRTGSGSVWPAMTVGSGSMKLGAGRIGCDRLHRVAPHRRRIVRPDASQM